MLIRLLGLYIPTYLILYYTVFGLMCLRTTMRQLAIFGLVQGLITLVVRDVLGLIGWHAVVLAVTHVTLVMLLMKASIFVAIFSNVIGLSLVMIGEVTIGKFVVTRFHSPDLSTLLESAEMHLVAGWASHVPVIILGILVFFWQRRRPGQGVKSIK